MIDDRELFERASLRFDPPQGGLERLLRRRDRRRRNRRIASAIAALLIATAAIGSLIKMFESGGRQPASGPITPSNVSDLRLLGSSPLDGSIFAVSDGLVYVTNDQKHELLAYPTSCYAITASCKPTWVAYLDHAGFVGLEAGGGTFTCRLMSCSRSPPPVARAARRAGRSGSARSLGRSVRDAVASSSARASSTPRETEGCTRSRRRAAADATPRG